jgi:hypothetical protein
VFAEEGAGANDPALATQTDTGDLVITGGSYDYIPAGTPVPGGGTTAFGEYVISANGTYNLSMKSGIKSTDNSIEIDDPATDVQINLDSIYFSGNSGSDCITDSSSRGTLTINLSGSNKMDQMIITSKNADGLIITGDGTLTTTGQIYAQQYSQYGGSIICTPYSTHSLVSDGDISFLGGSFTAVGVDNAQGYILSYHSSETPKLGSQMSALGVDNEGNYSKPLKWISITESAGTTGYTYAYQDTGIAANNVLIAGNNPSPVTPTPTVEPSAPSADTTTITTDASTTNPGTGISADTTPNGVACTLSFAALTIAAAYLAKRGLAK